MKIRIAVAPGATPVERADFCRFVDSLESLGFDTIWLSDVPLGSVVDPLVGLAVAAGRTERLKLGANVVVPGRHPLLLAKELAQLDRLSEGRLLLSFVPGQDTPAEREVLGVAKADRGAIIEETMSLCRRWWAGETIDHHSPRLTCTGVALRPGPRQDPLELWLGGIGPQALRRAGRLADGWLTARATPEEAAAGRETILRTAAEAGRAIDPEHFGISIPYARSEPPPAVVAATMRQSTAERSDVLPVGADELVDLVKRHIDAGLSKFVLRPVTRVGDSDDELGWLAETTLPLQT
jgi:probable F420-dependent oxidoreductase